MPEPVDKEISNAFEKLNIIDEQPYKKNFDVSLFLNDIEKNNFFDKL